jgi:hypothetical protein
VIFVLNQKKTFGDLFLGINNVASGFEDILMTTKIKGKDGGYFFYIIVIVLIVKYINKRIKKFFLDLYHKYIKLNALYVKSFTKT